MAEIQGVDSSSACDAGSIACLQDKGIEFVGRYYSRTTHIGGKFQVGVYGSGAVCTAMLNAGHATLAWLAQSTGWTGHAQFNAWAIKQGPEQSVCGLNSDTDVARDEFGGFTLTA